MFLALFHLFLVWEGGEGWRGRRGWMDFKNGTTGAWISQWVLILNPKPWRHKTKSSHLFLVWEGGEGWRGRRGRRDFKNGTTGAWISRWVLILNPKPSRKQNHPSILAWNLLSNSILVIWAHKKGMQLILQLVKTRRTWIGYMRMVHLGQRLT